MNEVRIIMSKAYMRHPSTGLIISTDGEVYIPYSRRHPAHWTKGSDTTNGYLRIKYKGRRYSVHRLVAETFLGNPENKPEVDHINRNRKDNRLDNLRWATTSENRRNSPQSDKVTAEGRTHFYEDKNKWRRERARVWYAENRERRLEYKREWRRRRRNGA